jgi:uncharacterized OsmC-like protein/predicted small metal-binding protein
MPPQLATSSVTSRLSGSPGRAIVTARGHHFVVDSPPPLGGPNEEINPIEVLLSALATCGTFVCETAAREMGISLNRLTVTVAGDFDPRGVCGEPVDPRIQAMRVHLLLDGPTQAQAEALVVAFQTRCPVYTTLSRATPITAEITVEGPPHEQGKVQTMKVLHCRDVGFECDHEIHAQSEEEVLRQAAEHAQKEHGVEVTPELAAQVQTLIRDEEQ